MKWAEMKPEERNRLVAEKVMGWQPKECDGEMGELPISPDGWFCQKCGVSGSWGDDYTHEERPPRYTQSLDAAWLVVEKMKEPDTDISWTNYSHFADLCSELEDMSENSSVFRVLWGLSPEKICLAALRAVGVEIE